MVAGLLTITVVGPLFGQTGYAKKVESDHSYYRMKVSLTVDKSEPLEIDLVMACGVYVRTYRDNDRSVYVSRDPRVYAVPTRTGHAVQVTTPSKPCSSGQTSDNHGVQWPGKRAGENMYGVPPDYLPLIVWYESADDLSLGIAYASDAAYDSPAARVAVKKATIHRATQAEYLAFKERGPLNLISPEAQANFLSTEDERRIDKAFDRDARSVWRERFSQHCYGYYRLEANSALAAVLRRHIPGDDLRFWAPEGAALREIDQFFLDLQTKPKNFSLSDRLFRSRPDGPSRILSDWVWISQDNPTTASLRKDGGGIIRGMGAPLTSKGPYPPAFFPLRSSRGIPWTEEAHHRDASAEAVLEVEVEAEKQGFLYCFHEVRQLTGHSTQGRLRVDGREVARWSHSADPRIQRFFDRDQYVFFRVVGFFM